MPQVRILIVEDEILVAESIRDKLLSLGYEILDVVAFGEDAVNIAVESQPDLILMDIKLAGEMDGVTAAEQIRANLKVPVIYLTAYADAETLQRAKIAEPFGYLLKPFRVGDLRSTIEMALYKHGMDEKLQTARQFIQSAFDALSAHIAILDGSGTIISVNASWRRFAEVNELAWQDYGVGRNYLEICESARGVNAKGASVAAKGIRQVIARKHKTFSLEYACHSPTEERWFTMRVTRFQDDNPIHVVVAHENITERKLAEEKVSWLAKFPAENPTPVFRVDKDGVVLYANRVSASLLDLWQCQVGTPLPDDWRTFAKEVFDSGLSGEVEVEHEDRIWALTFTPVEEAGYLNVYGIDVTERNRAEEELRKLSRAVEQSPSIVVITDVQGNIEYVNPTFTRLTGYRDDEVLGQNPRLLKSGHQSSEIYTQLWDTIVAGGEWRGELSNRKKNGQIYWELASISPIRGAEGAITHFLKVAEDITERKRAEDALEWEVTVNTVIAELSSALLSLTSLREISQFVLEQAKYLTSSEFGYVGYIDPESGYLVCPTMTRKIWGAYPFEDKDVVFKTFGGLWGWVLEQRQSILTNAPMDDPRSSGTPLGHVPVQRFLSTPAMIGDKLVGQVALANADHDYSTPDLELVERLADLYALALQRHWAQVALHQRTSELQAHNEELDAFAHTVAHDLKNPLGIIVGFAETLEDAYSAMLPEELREYLHIIAWNSRKMSNIVDELLLLAGVRKIEVERVPLDMVSIVLEVQQRLADMIEEYQAEIVTAPAVWPVALGHAPWVEEVWVNFLSNALKHGGRPPRVELGFDPVTDVRGAVRFWVRDNGPGLSPEEQTRLFVPFTQLAQVHAEGHGLGLSIVRRIVEKLGGQVGVESSGVSGEGCLFSFTLPSASEEI